MIGKFVIKNITDILLNTTTTTTKGPSIHTVTDSIAKHVVISLANTTFKSGTASDGADDKQLDNCSRDKSYVAIIISVLPIWAMITTLFLLALLHFGKHARLSKIYDNCTRQNATHVYHIELRTGDTSASYAKRKTAITIDMFDENQNTLARIAVPGHVIFGRKEDPVNIMDDDKFFELRITRLWLYRMSRLRRVTTIRLTHTCTEPEARIMVYGVELRVDDLDRPKLFFPVMNYITAYGAANKINTCFDLDNTGTISAMGGRTEPSLANEVLIPIDYSVLVYLFIDLVFFLSTFTVIQQSDTVTTRAISKGAIIGVASFMVTYLLGLIMRYVVKRQYAINVANGIWFYTYYLTNVLYVIFATAIWIYATIYAYHTLCTNHHTMWVVGLCFAAIIGFLCTVFVYYSYNLINQYRFPNQQDHFTMPDDGAQAGANRDDDNSVSNKENNSKGRARQQESAYQAAAAAAASAASPSALLMPNIAGPSNVSGMQPWQAQAGALGAPQPLPVMLQHHGFSPYPVYPNFQHQGTLKGFSMNQPYGTPQANQINTITQARPIIQHHPATPHGQSYHQQTTGSGGGITSGRTKTKKTGSQESTGSTYYQQLMKNKGGVKSISQYGELMKQKKNKK